MTLFLENQDGEFLSYFLHRTKVMDKLVSSSNESTFLKGSLLVYDVVVVNELIDFEKRPKKKVLYLG